MDEPNVTAVADPPQLQATTTSEGSEVKAELEKHSSFLGYRPAIEVTAEQPETSAATETTEEVETQPETATEAQTEPEGDPNWLPDEQSKVFPDDVIAKYGKRYGYTAEQIQENPSLRQLLHDKINSDIFIANQRTEAEGGTGEEPTLKKRRGDSRYSPCHS